MCIRDRPLYIAAGAFLVCAAVLPVYSLPGFLGACAVAAGAYFLSDKKIPPRVVMVPAPEDPFATGEEALDAALEKARDDLEKLEVLNARIPAAALSAQISRMEKAGAAILQQVREHPEKGRDIRKFVTYYLPTAVKILTTYADLSASGAGGENAKSLMSDVEKNAGTIASAFEAQLEDVYKRQRRSGAPAHNATGRRRSRFWRGRPKESRQARLPCWCMFCPLRRPSRRKTDCPSCPPARRHGLSRWR